MYGQFYVWNIGFNKLFPVLDPIGFVVSQTIAIELGLIAAVALAGAAVQLRLFELLRVRLRELTEEHRRRDAELEAQAAERFKDVEAARDEWEKKHGHAREDSADDGTSGGAAGSLSAAPLLLAGDGAQTPSEGPGTPATGGRPVSSLFSPAGAGNRTPMQSLDRPPQSPGALPALDLGNTVKDELPHDMIDKSTMIDDHPEIRERQQIVDEIRQIRRSLDTLGSGSRNVRPGRHSFGDLEKTTTTEAVAKTAVSRAARTSDPLEGRERVHSMILLPTRPASAAFASGPGAATSSTPPSTRPPSAPLADDDWETYVRERKLFQPPSGVTPSIQASDVPEALLANAGINRQRSSRSPPSEAVLTALAQRQRRETLFDPPSLRTQHESGDKSSGADTSTGSAQEAAAGGTLRSWIINKDETPAAPAAAARGTTPPGRRPSVNLVRAPSLNTSTALHTHPQQPHTPVTVLPPARAASQQPHMQAQSPSQPAERVLTFEEYSERHKARMRALQEPLTRQENNEATLADARARWEHSKTVESRVMARKQAEETAEVEARLRAEREAEKGERRRSRRDSKGTSMNKGPGPERTASSPSSPKREHRRNSLSLDKLSAPRMSTHVKVEEWQKYQAAAAAEEAATRGAGPSPPTPPSSPHRGHHRRNSSRRDL
jgi:hypothetical protein